MPSVSVNPTQPHHVDKILPVSRVPSQSISISEALPTHPTGAYLNSTTPTSTSSTADIDTGLRGYVSQGPSSQRRRHGGQENQGSELAQRDLNNDRIDNPEVESGERGDCEASREAGGQGGQDALELDEYWLSTTGCPLIAATLGPVANLLSVCALVQSFRVDAKDRADQEADPHWAYAINGLSLFLGVAANISLLLTLFHLAPYKFLQPFTAISWLLSAALLLSIIIVYIHTPTLNPHNLNPSVGASRKLIWSQSYYYAILSSTVYLIITLLLSINLYAAYVQKHCKAGLRELTNPQRTLILLSTGYMVYLSLGALAFTHIEHWRFLDAVYWADVTLLSIGIGSDFAPKTTTGRIFVVIYAWGGLVILGLLILGVRKLLVEKAKGQMRLATVRRGKRVVKWVVRRKWKGRLKGGEDRVQRVLEGCENSEGGGGGFQHSIQRDPREKAVEVHRKSTQWTKWLGLTYAFTAFLLLCLGGAAVFWFFEAEQHWTYGDALYFTNIALLTIGYGDLYPMSEGGKPFFVLWSLLAVPTVTALISSLQSVSFDRWHKAAERRERQR